MHGTARAARRRGESSTPCTACRPAPTLRRSAALTAVQEATGNDIHGVAGLRVAGRSAVRRGLSTVYLGPIPFTQAAGIVLRPASWLHRRSSVPWAGLRETRGRLRSDLALRSLRSVVCAARAPVSRIGARGPHRIAGGSGRARWIGSPARPATEPGAGNPLGPARFSDRREWSRTSTGRGGSSDGRTRSPCRNRRRSCGPS
jgi:hypothetical protein